MPELTVSVGAALQGSPDIAIGNVVGSNIANILLIVGAAAVLTPLLINRRAVRRDPYVMLQVYPCDAHVALKKGGARGVFFRE